MNKKITVNEIYKLVNTYLRTPANAYILKDENKATNAEYLQASGLIDYPGIPLPFPSTGSYYYYPTTLKAGHQVTSTGLLSQLERWAKLYSRVRYCKFTQQISGGAKPTVETYYKYCSFVNFGEQHLSLPVISIDLVQLKAASGIEQDAAVNIEQQVTEALNYMLPTLQEYWTDPTKGTAVSFCHSSCHADCHNSRNRR